MPLDDLVTPEEIQAMNLDKTEVQLLEIFRGDADACFFEDETLAEMLNLPTFYVTDKTGSLLQKMQAYGAELDAAEPTVEPQVKQPYIDKRIVEDVLLNQIFNSPN